MTPTPAPSLPRAVLLAYLLPAIAIAAAVFAWWGDAYWNYSDGVYLLTSRKLDAGLYSDIAVAQPPLLFWLGGAVLAVDDSLAAVRLVLSGVSVVTGFLVTASVWRLTQSRAGAAIAGLAVLVAPWHLHEALTLTPESIAAPLLLGAALLAAGSPRSNVAAGILAGAATCLKLAFALPAAALVLAARARSRYAVATVVTATVTMTVAVAIYGGHDLFENVVTAQTQTGTRGIGTVGPLFVQALWNLLPILIPAAFAWHVRDRLLDPALVRTLAALVAGELLLVPTVFKVGTSLNLIAVVEPAAIALAAAGVVTLARAERTPARTGGLVVVAALTGLLFLQSASLVVSPDHPRIFARPFSALAYQRTLSDSQVDRAARRIEACPFTSTFTGPPFLAFVAHRLMPGNQPDPFILEHTRVHADKALVGIGPACP